jgi:hypothetical protein
MEAAKKEENRKTLLEAYNVIDDLNKKELRKVNKKRKLKGLPPLFAWGLTEWGDGSVWG